MRKEKRQIPYLLVANLGIVKAINECVQESIGTLLIHIIHIYIHETLIPNMSKGMSNGKTKAQILENYGLSILCQETVGEWLINIGFKYEYSVNSYYLGGH